MALFVNIYRKGTNLFVHSQEKLGEIVMGLSMRSRKRFDLNDR
jgi:alkylated DNA repair dioxygenase AlkB